MARARLRRGIELVKLANRIEALKVQEEDPENTDVPDDATLAADQSQSSPVSPFAPSSSKIGGSAGASSQKPPAEKRSLSKTIKGAIFREVVLAKVREMKQQQESQKVQEEVKKLTGLEDK